MSEDIYLVSDNPNTAAEDGAMLLACKHCRNKTYRIEVAQDCGGRAYCAACGSFIGRLGWVPEDDFGPAEAG